MKRLFIASAMTALLIAGAAVQLNAQPKFRLPISITDINTTTGNHTATTYFGVHPNGSNQMDDTMFGFTDHWNEFLPFGLPYTPDMNEQEAPPSPPSGADIRVRNVTGNLLYPIVDIQKYSTALQVDTFIVHAQPDDPQALDTAVYQIPPGANQYADSIVLVQTSLSIRANLTANGGKYVALPDINFGTMYDFRIYLYHPKTPPAIPAPVTLVSPVDGAANRPLSPLLSWTPVAQALRYRYEIATDTTFAHPVKADTTSSASVVAAGLSATSTYYWHAFAVFTATGMSWFQFPAWHFSTGLVSAVDDRGNALPAAFALSQNYPNPFNPSTRIDYALPRAAEVRLSIYNLLGEEVRRLAEGMQDAGFKSVSFDASSLPTGLYICRLTAGNFTAVRKLALIR